MQAKHFIQLHQWDAGKLTVRLMPKISLPLLTKRIYYFNLLLKIFFLIFFGCVFVTSAPQDLLMVIC